MQNIPKIGILMDPIQTITAYKDSTLAMMLAAQKKGWELHYLEQGDLHIENGVLFANTRTVIVHNDNTHWFDFTSNKNIIEAGELDAILMRIDPPFDIEFLHTCHLLDLAEQQGCLVVNRPDALRDFNEKLFITWFPDCCAPTIVSRNNDQIRGFLDNHGDIIVKPLDGMGGMSIFRIKEGDNNTNVILETMMGDNQTLVMAQKYIADIKDGDKRILMVDGEHIGYALARIPAEGEHRGNLAAGGNGVGRPMSKRDKEIANTIGPVLKERGILFAGLDVIGDYLTEINVTSPTCIRELDAQFNLDIAGQLMDCIEEKLQA